MFGPNTWNPRGMFENRFVREEMVKPYLRAIMADPKGQAPLPVASSVPIVQDWNLVFRECMESHGYVDGQIFYKGAKACLMWPVWHVAFPKARWLLVRRDARSIINSCMRTPFMNAYKDMEGWLGWVEHHIECFEEMTYAGLDMAEIWTPDIIKGDLSGVEEMLQWLELEYDEDQIRGLISPELWHSDVDS